MTVSLRSPVTSDLGSALRLDVVQRTYNAQAFWIDQNPYPVRCLHLSLPLALMLARFRSLSNWGASTLANRTVCSPWYVLVRRDIPMSLWPCSQKPTARS